MHKKIKLIIATSLVLGAVSGILPANNFVIGSTTKAYASSYDDDDDDYYDDEDDYDKAYLENVELSAGKIDFYRSTTDYNVNVNKDTDKITIKAEPEDKDCAVEIDGNPVDKDDDYERSVKLENGNNKIKIHAETQDEKKDYVLNIYRGDVSNATASGTTTTNGMTAVTGTSEATGIQNFKLEEEKIKFNAWNRVNGKWKYIDGTGQPLKNVPWFDKTTGINYFLDKDGYRTTGWFYNNNNWFYYNENGEMKTGWVSVNKNWYYLNQSGAMKMGWLADSDGNWYYLSNDGAMKIGWLEDSDGKWYYLDSTGKMIKDSTISGYTVDTKGVLVNG